VETLGEISKRFALPRIRFKVSLPFGKSFKIVRTQFPLRLSYCLTLNKSQSQTFDKAVVDVCHEPFCHGQLYVAVSRVRESKNIMLFCNNMQLIAQGGGVILTNIVFPSLLLSDEDFCVSHLFEPSL
jgi:Helicase